MGLKFTEDGLYFEEPKDLTEMESILYRIVVNNPSNHSDKDIYKLEYDPILDFCRITTNCANWRDIDSHIKMYRRVISQLENLKREIEE